MRRRGLYFTILATIGAGCDSQVVQVLTPRVDAAEVGDVGLDAEVDAPSADAQADAALPPCPSVFEENTPVEAGAAASGPRVAWTGSHLLVVWRTDAGVWTQRWSASGDALEVERLLDETAGCSVPTLARHAEGYVVAFAKETGVYMLRLDGDGIATGGVLTVSGSASVDTSFSELALGVHADGGVSVVWPDLRHGDAELYFGGVDGSLAPLEERRLTDADGASVQCRVVVSAEGASIVWADGRGESSDIWFLGVNRSGEVTAPGTPVLPQAGFDGDPRITSTRSGLLLVYNHEQSLYSAVLDEDGNVISPSHLVGIDDGYYSYDPNVLPYGDGFVVAWQDYRDGNLELYYQRLGATGESLESDQRLTGSPGGSVDADLVNVEGDIHVVWVDERNGAAMPFHGRLPCLP